jgi:4'-phosphopantetheinyl transferase
MDEETAYLWCAHPEDISGEADSEACRSLLSDEEQARLRAFRFDRHRREYLTTRALVRTALSTYHPTAPEAWRFISNGYGKPAVTKDCGLKFNLSNSPGLVVCLIAKGVEVGVDVEPYERTEQIAEVATEVFSPPELGQLAELDRGDRLARGLSLWTLKEAYVKATGLGMSFPLKEVSFLFGGAEGIRLEAKAPLVQGTGKDWRFCLFDHAGHRIALAVERAASPKLKILEARPVLAAAVELPEIAIQWYPGP